MHEYLMNVASALYILCYVPELYANYKNKNANVYNIPEKIVMLTATGFALSYAIMNQDQALMLNYVPIFGLDVIAFLMRMYYMRIGTRQALAKSESCTDLTCVDPQSLHTPPPPLQISIPGSGAR
jgi:uncharacterized protein with PQ loop repeat